MNRRTGYEWLSAAALGISAGGAVLAIAGAALQQALGVAAASLCAVAFLVPGLFFLAYSRRLRVRDLALAHTAGFVRTRESIRIQDLADELKVPLQDAERILRIAIQEGYLTGTFESGDRFVSGPSPIRPPEAER